MIDEKTKIATKNEIIERRARWSSLMGRCYVQVLGEFETRYEEWKRLDPKNLFGDPDYSYLCKYSFKATEIDGVSVSHVTNALMKLTKEGMTIRYPNGSWELINIISKSSFDAAKAEYTVKLNEEFVPYLVFARKQGGYTTFNACIARQFRGKYTERFYEFIQEYRLDNQKRFFLMVQNMREQFGLTADKDGGKEKYSTQKDFVRYVIEPSREEMKSLYDDGSCDVYFDWDIPKEEKTISKNGRRESDRIWFTIHEREIMHYNPGQKKAPSDIIQKKARVVELFPELLQKLRTIFQANEPGNRYVDYIERPLADACAIDQEVFFKLMERVDEISVSADVMNRPGLMRHILETDYHIKMPDKTGRGLIDRNVGKISAGLAEQFSINKRR